MSGQLEDLAVVRPLALEHGRRDLQAEGEEVRLRLAPGYELAVQPGPEMGIAS